MKRLILLPILMTSFSFSSDMDLYTSAVLKLVKENKLIKKQIKLNMHELTVLKLKVKKQKDGLEQSLNIKEFKNKSAEDELNIAKIDSFIDSNS